MGKRLHRRRKQKQSPVPSVIAGLFFIGIAVLLFSSGNTKGTPEVGADLNSPSLLSVNFPAPVLSLENLNGKIESLADYREQVVLINNWATWCPPCKAEMPVLEAYYEDHAGQGFTIIAIEAGEPKNIVSEFVEEYNLKFQVWLDPNGASIKAFGNGNLPNSLVIDRTGTVRYAWTGEVNRDTLEKYVTPLLDE